LYEVSLSWISTKKYLVTNKRKFDAVSPRTGVNPSDVLWLYEDEVGNFENVDCRQNVCS
jgi:hypothetical protein